MDIKTLKFEVLDAEACRKVLAEGSSDSLTLDVHNRGIREINNLAELPNLRSLDVSFNELASLRGINKLKELRELKAYHNRLASTDGLQENRMLEMLYLNDNHIRTMSEALLSLRALRFLRLDKNVIGRISGLDGCRSLTYLDLSQNRLSSLEGLQSCSSLEQLNVNENQIQDLSPLKNLKQLSELQVCGNLLRHVNGIEHLRSLSVLRISRNQLPSLKCFPIMPALTELYVDRNQLITLLAAGELFPKLDILDASNNLIMDLQSVASLKALDEIHQLWLTGNPCSKTESYFKDVKTILKKLQFLDDHEYGADGTAVPTAASRPGSAAIRPGSASSRAVASNRPGSSKGRTGTTHSQGSLSARSDGSDSMSIPLFRSGTSRIGPEMKLLSAEELDQKVSRMKESLRSARSKLDCLLSPRTHGTKEEETSLNTVRYSRSHESRKSFSRESTLGTAKRTEDGSDRRIVTKADAGTNPMSPTKRSEVPRLPVEGIANNEDERQQSKHTELNPEDDTAESWLLMQSPRFEAIKRAELKKPPSRGTRSLASYNSFQIPTSARKIIEADLPH